MNPQIKAREFDINHAFEILEEYSKPNSMIDNGNLFFAACEYQDAYQKAVEALKEISEYKWCPACKGYEQGSMAKETLRELGVE